MAPGVRLGFGPGSHPLPYFAVQFSRIVRVPMYHAAMPSEEQMRPEFAITRHAIDDERGVVAVRGEIDLFTARQFKQALTASIDMGFVRIVVDLTETTFLDSAGLGALIGVLKRLRARHGALAIVNVNEPVARTFAATGMDQIFTILPTRDDALKAVAAASAA